MPSRFGASEVASHHVLTEPVAAQPVDVDVDDGGSDVEHHLAGMGVQGVRFLEWW